MRRLTILLLSLALLLALPGCSAREQSIYGQEDEHHGANALLKHLDLIEENA